MADVRAALVDDGKFLAGLVEMDEAYVGGKPRRSNRKACLSGYRPLVLPIAARCSGVIASMI